MTSATSGQSCDDGVPAGEGRDHDADYIIYLLVGLR